nr:hypothetical protein Iba_chr09fCG8040 [Ipomoea batatas]
MVVFRGFDPFGKRVLDSSAKPVPLRAPVKETHRLGVNKGRLRMWKQAKGGPRTISSRVRSAGDKPCDIAVGSYFFILRSKPNLKVSTK